MNADSSLTRAAFLLPPGQGKVFAFVRAYCELVDEPAPASVVARRLKLNPSTVREYFDKLHRKGWLITSASPARPRDRKDEFRRR
jgi:DNA-binding MarR family transcriptional regulator